VANLTNINCPAVERNNRLLIIDDNWAIHDDFRKMLHFDDTSAHRYANATATLFGEDLADCSSSTESFELDSAYQEEEGVVLIQEAIKQGRPYAVVFVNVRMPPGCDGVDTARKILEIDPDIQIVICTAHADYSYDEMFKKIGDRDGLLILKKPFDPVEALQMAHALSAKWRLHRQCRQKMEELESGVVERARQLLRTNRTLEAEVAEHKQAVEELRGKTAFFEALAISSFDGILVIDQHQNTALQNQRFIDLFRIPREMADQKSDEARLKWVTDMIMNPERFIQEVHYLYAHPDEISRDEIELKDGTVLDRYSSPVVGKDEQYYGRIWRFRDITADKKAQKDRSLMEAQLRQAQKLESVGQLAAGIAHEINTPIQYIGDNIHFIEESFTTLGGAVQDCKKLAAAVRSNTVTPEVLSAVELSIQKADVDYLGKEVPLAIEQSLQGVVQVSRIVHAMKEFSHPGTREKVAIDLNHAIEMTVLVARNEWKYAAEMVTDFAPDLPPVLCLPGEFNQVILNLIINASHAIGNVVKPPEGGKGTIRVSTRGEGDWVEIRITDTGTGIPVEIRHRIFDPFFTTKPVGKGTGQGLAIARSVIVDKHGGSLSFESEVGRGTTFIIRLPRRESVGEGEGA
jgi:signal transduction histidine kinase